MKLDPSDQLLNRIDALLASQNKHARFERVMELCNNPTQYAREIYWPEHIISNHEPDPDIDDPFVERHIEQYMHGDPAYNPFTHSILMHDSNCVAMCSACEEADTGSIAKLFCRDCEAMNEAERMERYSDYGPSLQSVMFHVQFHTDNPDLPVPLFSSQICSQPMVS